MDLAGSDVTRYRKENSRGDDGETRADESRLGGNNYWPRGSNRSRTSTRSCPPARLPACPLRDLQVRKYQGTSLQSIRPTATCHLPPTSPADCVFFYYVVSAFVCTVLTIPGESAPSFAPSARLQICQQICQQRLNSLITVTHYSHPQFLHLFLPPWQLAFSHLITRHRSRNSLPTCDQASTTPSSVNT